MNESHQIRPFILLYRVPAMRLSRVSFLPHTHPRIVLVSMALVSVWWNAG